MQAFYGTRISNHMSTTPEGFLVCHDAVLCRTAVNQPQKYRGSELGLRTGETVNVYRSPEEVLSRKFLASLEGKPVTDSHPGQFLTSENASWYSKGHAQHVRPGPKLPDGEQSVVGDLVITDAALIQKIRDGVRELSVGYNCEYFDNGDGTFMQQKLAANHVAVVPTGRAGEHVRILDAHSEPAEDFASMARQYHRQNISEVSERRKTILESRAKDGVAEEMLHSAEPRSFDDLADEISERMNHGEEDMSKKLTADDLSGLKAFIKKTIQEVVDEMMPSSRRVEEPEFEEVVNDAHPTLANLRKLRPMIEATGDRTAIDAYNTAYRTVRRMGNNLVSVSDNGHAARRMAADKDQAWFDRVNEIGRQKRGEPEKVSLNQRASDSSGRPNDQDWCDLVNETGRRMRERYEKKK